MRTEISKKIFTILAVAIFSMFIATPVMAQDLPLSCTDGTFTMVPAPNASGEFPYYVPEGGVCGEKGGWEWDYIVSVENPKTLSSLTKVFFYGPSIGLSDIGVLDNTQSNFTVHVYDRGEGALNTDFGKGIYNGITWDATNYSGTGGETTVSFCTQSNSKGLISSAFVGSKFINGCMATTSEGTIIGGIVGPSPGTDIPFREASSQTFTKSENGVTCTATITESGGEPLVTMDGPCSYAVKQLKDMTFEGKKITEFPRGQWVGTHSSPGKYTYCYPSGYCATFSF